MGVLLQPTTKMFWSPGGAGYSQFKGLSRSPGGAGYADAKLIYYGPPGGPYVLKYSTPSGTQAVTSGTPDPAAPGGNGTASQVITVTPGGNNSGDLSYNWARAGGSPSNFTYTPSGNQITASYAFSGVPNGSTSSLPAESIYCDITDNVTGAVYRTDNITVGGFSYTNQTPAYGPFQATSPGGSTSGQSSAGAAHSINDIADVQATVSVASGGPVSGNFSYNWFVETGATGATLQNASSQTCNVHFNWNIPAATSSTLTVLLGCTMTDLTSGYSSTIHDVLVSRNYTNNTG